MLTAYLIIAVIMCGLMVFHTMYLANMSNPINGMVFTVDIVYGLLWPLVLVFLIGKYLYKFIFNVPMGIIYTRMIVRRSEYKHRRAEADRVMEEKRKLKAGLKDFYKERKVKV